MSQVQGGNTGPMMTPPMKQGAIPAQPSVWPTAIGVIGIIFASFAILGGCWGGISPWIMEAFTQALPEAQQDTMSAMAQWKLWIIVSSVIGVAFGVLLLIGSLRLLSRRQSSRGLIMIWAVLKIFVYAVGSSILSFVMTQAALSQDDPNTAQLPKGFLEWMGPIGAVFNFLWYSALPVFMLIWFSRPKIKAEMQHWAR